MQPIRTIWTTLVGDHPGIIPVKSKSNEWFQRRRCLSKKVYARRATDDDGQSPATIAHHKHFVLRWAKNWFSFPNIYQDTSSLCVYKAKMIYITRLISRSRGFVTVMFDLWIDLIATIAPWLKHQFKLHLFNTYFIQQACMIIVRLSLKLWISSASYLHITPLDCYI